MPGLLNDPSALDQTAAPAADPNAAADTNASPAPEEQGETVPDDEQGEPATPEEQAKYDEFVKAGYGMMYAGGKVNPDIMKMLDNDPSDLIAALGNADELQNFSPVIALAATAAIITLQVCKKTGEKDGTIILHGGKAILEDLVEVAGKAGVHDYSQDDIDQAMHVGADLFRHAAQGTGIVNEDEAKQDWNTITTADKEGKLGDVIPQFKGAEQQAQQAPEGGNAA